MNTLALFDGAPAVQTPFPPWPYHTDLEQRRLQAVLEQGSWWRMTGVQVKEFERDFATAHGAAYGLAVTNGTHALEAALRALGIGPGDEVIIPAMTFIATATAVLMVGACPVAVDVLPDTWCIDPKCIAAAITPRTRAVIPVHFAGHIADMAQIGAICRRHRLALIEDAAHAHGARWQGQAAGSFGDFAAFSFQNFKLLTAGEGGALLTSNADLYEQALLVINCGRRPGDTSYEHSVLGSNYRMSEFQAAVLNAQLARMELLAERRERNGAILEDALRDLDGIAPQGRDPRVERHARYMAIFCYDPAAFEGLPRELFVAALVAEGVPAYRIYPRVQDTTFYTPALARVGAARRTPPACPVSAYLADHGVWLHHRVLLGDAETALQVAAAIAKIRAHAGELAERYALAPV